MVGKVLSVLPYGYDSVAIEIESDSNRGLPGFQIVGMGNKTIEESKERIRSAINNSNLTFPNKKITINLAPADLQKDGAYLDLPIALSVLIISNQLNQSDVGNNVFVGELALDGSIRPVRGIVNIIEGAKKNNVKSVFIPIDNISQARLVSGVNIIGVKSLSELFLHLKSERPIKNDEFSQNSKRRKLNNVILDHIIGQDQAKRALTIAIAGRHNILISGPPGAGKTMLAKAATNLLPTPSNKEVISITKIHSLAGLSDSSIVTTRPFRAPHHSSSLVSIIGGGSKPKPGEISLATHGVLFLDEMPEYPRSVLEALRQPLEDKKVTVSRTNYKTTYPADFILIATMNPCPCGFLGDATKECSCSSLQIVNYQKKISGPLLDRIDLVVEVSKVPSKELLNRKETSSSQHETSIRAIYGAIKKQRDRYSSTRHYNGLLSSNEATRLFKMSEEAKRLLSVAADKLALSARSYFKVLKVAQTIVDLEDGNDSIIDKKHISEALQYRKR